MKNFLITNGLKVYRNVENAKHPDSRHAAFFITLENFKEIETYLVSKPVKFVNERYKKVFSPGNDTIVRFKDEEITSKVVFCKLMHETSKKGNVYLKVDFANCLNNQKANHRIIISEPNNCLKFKNKVHFELHYAVCRKENIIKHVYIVNN